MCWCPSVLLQLDFQFQEKDEVTGRQIRHVLMWVKNWHVIAFPWGTSYQCMNSWFQQTRTDTQSHGAQPHECQKNDEHPSYFPPHLICCLQTIGSQLETQIPSPATTESSWCLVTVQVWGPRWNHRTYTSCGKRKISREWSKNSSYAGSCLDIPEKVILNERSDMFKSGRVFNYYEPDLRAFWSHVIQMQWLLCMSQKR